MWKTWPTEAIPMSDTGNCKSMELMCRQRADADLQNRHKWLAQAERWRELAEPRIPGAFRKLPSK
jgi:hypothetical protein